MSKQEISIRFRFEFAHRLRNHKGKCNNIHGHSGIAWVYFTGEVNEQIGMMADFNDIKKTIQAWIDGYWDHALILNSDDADLLNAFRITPIKVYQTTGDPTMETLSRILYQVVETLKADEKIPASLMLSHVTIQETENAVVSYSYQQTDDEVDSQTELKEFKESIGTDIGGDKIDDLNQQLRVLKDKQQALLIAEKVIIELLAEEKGRHLSNKVKNYAEETQSEWITRGTEESKLEDEQ